MAEGSSFNELPEEDSKLFDSFRLEQMKDQNEILIRENNYLKLQFDKAFFMLQRVEEFQSQNSQLLSKNRELASQADELTKRLAISVQYSNEVENKLNKEISEIKQVHQQEFNQWKEETEKLKIQYHAQGKSLCAQIDKLKAAKVKADVERKSAYGKFEKVFQAASIFFNAEIESLDQLVNLMSKPIQSTVEAIIKDEVAEKKYQNEKAKNKILTKVIQEYENKFVEKEKTSEEGINKLRKENADLNALLTKLKQEMYLGQRNYQNEIELLTEKLKKSEEELRKTKDVALKLSDQIKQDLKEKEKEKRLMQLPKPRT